MMTNTIYLAIGFLLINSVLVFKIVYAQYGGAQDSSFDSLVASQCRARCIGLYPWKSYPVVEPEPSALRYFQKRVSSIVIKYLISVKGHYIHIPMNIYMLF